MGAPMGNKNAAGYRGGAKKGTKRYVPKILRKKKKTTSIFKKNKPKKYVPVMFRKKK